MVNINIWELCLNFKQQKKWQSDSCKLILGYKEIWWGTERL